jgi:hypothetical protein
MEGNKFKEQFLKFPGEKHQFPRQEEIVLGTTADDANHVGLKLVSDLLPDTNGDEGELYRVMHMEVNSALNNPEPTDISRTTFPLERLDRREPGEVSRTYPTPEGDLILPWDQAAPSTFGGQEIGPLQEYYIQPENL